MLGKRIHIPNARQQWSTVVGVAADVHHESLDADDRRSFYVPESAWGWANGSGMLVVRARSTSPALMRQVRAAVAAVDPSQPVTDMRTMDAVVASSAAQRSLALTLFAAFATLALLLSAAGIYGVLAGSVAERTREIGLRSALGATPGDLLRMVLARGLGLAAVGVVLGLIGAFATTRYLRRLAVWRRTDGPAHAWRGGRASAHRCGCRVLRAGAPSDSRRPNGGASGVDSFDRLSWRFAISVGRQRATASPTMTAPPMMKARAPLSRTPARNRSPT